MTHLILHKVRGEPAFDVASKLMIGDEEGWIIPTSGHRAYPYQVMLLEDAINEGLKFGMTRIPPDWPDHYNQDKGEAPKANFNIMEVISPMMRRFKRRL